MRLLKSFSYAVQGIRYSLKTQPNFRIHILGFVFMNISAVYLGFTIIEYILCFILSTMVFSAELFNTAIEAVVDMNMKEIHPLAKIAKDCAAAAVLLFAITAVVSWVVIVYNRF